MLKGREFEIPAGAKIQISQRIAVQAKEIGFHGKTLSK